MKELSITLSLQEVESLHKTIGIAIQNLISKMTKYGPDSKYGKESSADMRNLVAVQEEILSLLYESA
jgi:hypothetical protein